MIRVIQSLVSRKAALALATIVGLGSVAATPQTASAGFRFGIDIRDDGPRPTYVRATQVWVPATYRTVCERVWVPAAYRTVTERVWVPDRYEDRQVVRYIGWHRHLECVRVLVERGHYEDQCRQVEVSAGHWGQVERQELVCAGHWEERQERVAYSPPGPRVDRLHFEFGHR